MGGPFAVLCIKLPWMNLDMDRKVEIMQKIRHQLFNSNQTLVTSIIIINIVLSI